MQSITSTESNGSTQLLLPSPQLAFIDSTVSDIYLPSDACKSFERVFGLVWNSTYKKYVIDDEIHNMLVARSPVFTLDIGNSKTGGPTVEITLPYASFDLTFKPDLDSAPMRYFPIQQAANETQVTLGRAFLQETYIITDYQRGNFSVSQCRFEESIEPDIVSILSRDLQAAPSPPAVDEPGSDRHSHLQREAIIGIAIGAVLAFIILIVLCYWLCCARCSSKKNKSTPNSGAVVSSTRDIQDVFQVNCMTSQASSNGSTPSLKSLMELYETNHKSAQEIDTTTWNFENEAPDTGKFELPDNPRLFELAHEVCPTGLKDPTPRATSKNRLRLSVNLRKRHGLMLSTGSLLSTGNIVKYFLELSDPGYSQNDTWVRVTKPAPSRYKEAGLEKSLPTTPISESPQDTHFPTWTRIARHQHEERETNSPPSCQQPSQYQHRRGFF